MVELLVVIVILVTLVGGVLPLISPNNEARKIREASRSLQTFITQAQAQAARTGRPVGIGFRETTGGSGIALEIFQVQVPPEFPGYSEYSRAEPTRLEQRYGTGGNEGTMFADRYDGDYLYDVRFINAAGVAEEIPPRMFRIGDTLDVDGHEFLIVDKGGTNLAQIQQAPNAIDSDDYATGFLMPTGSLHCVWTNPSRSKLVPPKSPRPYSIARQPAAPKLIFGATLAQPLQLPSGIAVDLQGSGAYTNGTLGFFAPPPEDIAFGRGGPPPANGFILMSPSGGIESVWANGRKVPNTSDAFLLVGRAENGTLAVGDWNAQGLSNEEVEQLRQRVNWLNPESRWITIGGQSARISVAENTQFDLHAPAVTAGNPGETKINQIRAAQRLARSGGGGG